MDIHSPRKFFLLSAGGGLLDAIFKILELFCTENFFNKNFFPKNPLFTGSFGRIQIAVYINAMPLLG